MKSISSDLNIVLLIPELTDSEYESLKKSIEKGGLRDRIVVIDRGDSYVIVDGHHRYKVCMELGIVLTDDNILVIQFISDEEIIDWMIENQCGRRNMTTLQKCEMALKLEEHYKSMPQWKIKGIRVMTRKSGTSTKNSHKNESQQ